METPYEVDKGSGGHPGAGWLNDPGKRFASTDKAEYASPMDAVAATSNMPHLMVPKNPPVAGTDPNGTREIPSPPQGEDYKNPNETYADPKGNSGDLFHPHLTPGQEARKGYGGPTTVATNG